MCKIIIFLILTTKVVIEYRHQHSWKIGRQIILSMCPYLQSFIILQWFNLSRSIILQMTNKGHFASFKYIYAFYDSRNCQTWIQPSICLTFKTWVDNFRHYKFWKAGNWLSMCKSFKYKNGRVSKFILGIGEKIQMRNRNNWRKTLWI